MAQSNWEADKMLDVYIHDYLLKRKLHASAKAFMAEGKVATDPVAIDAPGGFLFEWWSVFWDIFIARTNAKHSEPAASYIEVQQIKGREQQRLNMQQRNAQLQRGNPNHYVNNIHPDGIMGQPSASLLAMKMHESMKSPQAMELDTSPSLIDGNRMSLLRSEHQGQLFQGHSGNISALQQIPSRAPLTAEVKNEVMGANQKSLPLDPSIFGQAILQSKSGPGLSQGVTSLPLKGWPLTPSLSLQKPNMQTQSQFLLASQQQQALAQVHTHSSLGSSSQYADMDPRRFGGLPRSGLPAKDGQSTKNEGSICSPGQANSPKMKMSQMQQSSSQQQDQLQQQQVPQQNGRKRKQQSSSGPANSTGTGNTAGPSPASPQSTHTPGEGITTASSMQRTNSVQNKMIMYGSEGNGVLASTSNMLDDLDHFDDLGSLDENVNSFLTSDGGDANNFYGTLKQNPIGTRKEGSKGSEYPLGEVGCIREGNGKVTCCHFSSDGKLLASAGHDKKVVIWNMDTLRTESTPEEHKSVITDVRFRPNSTQLATTSVDKSVRLWDAANPSFCLNAYIGHTSEIMSLDFNPVKTDLFCFCDNDNEIRYLDINTFNCTRICKGGAGQVRFQARAGKLLAAASDKVVSIFDVETDRKMHTFQGHPDLVNYICWDPLGDYLASVSQNLVKVWSLTSGQCIQEHMSANGYQFHSCVFHLGYSTILAIGGVSSLELWNVADNKSVLIPAHENIISALSYTPVTNLVASASHDSSVKIWK